MDGRIQIPVIRYLQQRFNADYVDSITEPGPNLILSDQIEMATVQSIFKRLDISVERHNSVGIAVVGHYDCAGNPAPQDEQETHIQNAILFLQKKYREIEILGLWVDKDFKVHEIDKSG